MGASSVVARAGPRWAERLGEHAGELVDPDPSTRERARAHVWELLRPALVFRIERHASRLGRLPEEEIRDLASEKSLEILRTIETGRWNAADRSASEISAFISKVARNGLVDRLRKAGRVVRSLDREDAPEPAHPGGERDDPSPEARLAIRELAAALKECAARLAPRERRLWIMRALLELPTKEIARRITPPLKAGHVDVLLKRTRAALTDCLAKKGMGAGDVRTGVFAELWFAFRPEIESLGRDS